MSRLPYPDPESLSEAKRAILDDPEIRTLNVSRFCMYAPEAQWAGQRALGLANVHGLTIDPRLREYVVLRTAYMADCAYELHHHKSIATALGVGDDVFEALRLGDFSSFPPLERAICQFVTEIVRDISPSEETLATLRGLTSEAMVFEIIFLAGYYMILARVVAVGGPALEDEPVRIWK